MYVGSSVYFRISIRKSNKEIPLLTKEIFNMTSELSFAS